MSQGSHTSSYNIVPIHWRHSLPKTRMNTTPDPRSPPTGAASDGSEPLRQIVAAAVEPPPSHLGARLRSYFLTGLIVVGPVAITIYVVWWFINLVDAWVKPIIPQEYLPDQYYPSTCRGSDLSLVLSG